MPPGSPTAATPPSDHEIHCRVKRRGAAASEGNGAWGERSHLPVGWRAPVTRSEALLERDFEQIRSR